MKTAVLNFSGRLGRQAADFIIAIPRLDRRRLAAVLLAAPVLFLGPYIVPFMLALALFAATAGVFVIFALRAGLALWQAALPLVAMLPFVGVVSSVESLPNWMQIVSHIFPPTYIFEGVRTLAVYGAFDSAAFVASVLLTCTYLFFIYLWGEAQKG